MKISQFLYRLLFLWLLLTTFQHHFTFTSKVQATKSVDLKISPAEFNSKSRMGHTASNFANEKKTRKAPSGPNPSGNHLPPSRT
nr:CLAVATA3/ESR (CLE)-related protein 46 [Coffea arabica]